jgi:hypothetical protein
MARCLLKRGENFTFNFTLMIPGLNTVEAHRDESDGPVRLGYAELTFSESTEATTTATRRSQSWFNIMYV